MHTHANAWWTAELYGKRVLGLTEADVCFSAAKLYFAYGLGNALTFPLSVGATRAADGRAADAGRGLQALDRRRRRRGHGTPIRPTVFFGAPTGFAGMLASPALPAREAVALRMCSSAGEALPSRARPALRAPLRLRRSSTASARPRCCTSSSPTGSATCATAPPASRSTGYEIELRGDDGRPVADGEVGDLYIKGPSAALMYWGNREKSRETFQGGWTKSGDKYVRDADGYYTYSGRSDDMLKVSGIWVSPFEVEATLMQHPAVLECAVIGTEDAEGLTKTKAFVVAKPGQAVSDGRAQGLRQGEARSLQVPARDRVPRRAAEDGHRQDPALSPARARARAAQRS